MFDFLKSGQAEENIPPDIGKEDSFQSNKKKLAEKKGLFGFLKPKTELDNPLENAYDLDGDGNPDKDPKKNPKNQNQTLVNPVDGDEESNSDSENSDNEQDSDLEEPLKQGKTKTNSKNKNSGKKTKKVYIGEQGVSQRFLANRQDNINPIHVNIAPANSIEFEKINARLELMSTLIKDSSERFSGVSQQIGELRAMNFENEKKISQIQKDSTMAIDIVKQVEPEKLRIDYQKFEMRISELSERIEMNKQLMEKAMTEFKDLKRETDTFVGTDAILKLNEEVKKDLLNTQKVSSKTKLYADKSEQIFVELKNSFLESQKVGSVVENLNNSYSELNKELQKIKLTNTQGVNIGDFNNLKRDLNVQFKKVKIDLNKSAVYDNEIKKLNRLLETSLLISKKNKDEISVISSKLGDYEMENIGDYENRLNSMLDVIDDLSGQVTEMKKQLISLNKKDRSNQENLFELNKLLKEGNELLEAGKIMDAEATYDNVKVLWLSLEKKDLSLHKKIVDFYDRILKAQEI